MQNTPSTPPAASELRRNAEAHLRKQERLQRKPAGRASTADSQRMLHELQVHQIELEMQNAQLHDSRDRMEALLEKYTDLYDFAPVGYFSLDEEGHILEVSLKGASLLGVERSRLLHQRLPRFVIPANQPLFRTFLKQVFDGSGKLVCEVELRKENGTGFWATCHGASAIDLSGPQKWCRLVISDITVSKRGEAAQLRAEALTTSNRELREEIARRHAVEKTLRQSERHSRRLLAQSHIMQERLRHLSHQVMSIQEEERRRISRELHDVISQELTGINVRLANLRSEAAVNTRGITRNIARTQQLVERSVDIVHRFARELRPAMLDDLGLIPALHSFMKGFTKETGIRVSLTAFAGANKLDSATRTVLYRVAQEALTNVSRHAQASRVDAALKRLPKAVCLQIKDNGQSFDVERMWHAGKSQHLGLLGMRERVEMVGGTFAVESTPEHGTTIRAQIPFGNSKGTH